MHLYIAARAQRDVLNRWEDAVNTKYYPFDTGQGMAGLQLGLRPIRFYEVAFPEPELKNVLQLIQPQPMWNSAYDKYVWAMRNLMKLDAIPEYKIDPTVVNNMCHRDFMNRDFVNIMGIGLKVDARKDKIEVVKTPQIEQI